jgi:glycolate oxidase
MYDEEDVEWMYRIRRAIDPQEIANRGKMLGAGDERARASGLHPLERAGVISRV